MGPPAARQQHVCVHAPDHAQHPPPCSLQAVCLDPRYAGRKTHELVYGTAGGALTLSSKAGAAAASAAATCQLSGFELPVVEPCQLIPEPGAQAHSTWVCWYSMQPVPTAFLNEPHVLLLLNNCSPPCVYVQAAMQDCLGSKETVLFNGRACPPVC